MNVLNFAKSLFIGSVILGFPRLIEALINWKYVENFETLVLNMGMGFRFDLLILSFLLLPILLLFMFQQRISFFKYIDRYAIVVWLMVAGVYFYNFLYLNLYQDRIWSEDWQQTSELFKLSSLSALFGSALAAILIFLSGVSLFQSFRKTFFKTNKGSLIVMLLILAVLARGSLGEDHLRRNHCDGKKNSVVRALCLNPLYVATKIKNQEFSP